MTGKEERAAWIYYQLKRKRLTAAEVARRLKVSRCWVSQVIHGDKKGLRVRRYICRAIGRSYERVWGEKAENRGQGSGFRGQ
jgi:transcriptional regulator with XRE-family HTH domain